MSWGDWDDNTKKWEEEISLSEPKYCYHKWKAVLLLTSTVYDCEKCGIHKEEVLKGDNK